MKNIKYDEHSKQFGMRCFADCTLSHPIDLLRLGGDKSWKRLGEKLIEYRTNLDNNRRRVVSMITVGYICPRPNCGAIIDGIPPVSETKIIHCPTCNRSFCRHCVFALQVSLLGNEESKDGKCPHIEDLEEDHSFRRCPMCHTPITHYYGDEVRNCVECDM